ncbi:MAG: phosphate ABC transporter substrate-binding/OmpA family protein [Pseudomonadota bacterium]
MRKSKLGLVSALALTLAGGAAFAQDSTITLKSFDGFTQLRGELLGFEDGFYTIQTRLGTLRVDGGQVTCEGDGCPSNLLFGAEFAIRGSNTVGEDLMPLLIEGYADSLDATLEREISTDGTGRTFRIIHENGEEMAAIDLVALGSSAAFPALTDGEAQIGMSSRRITEQEVASLGNAGLDDPRDTDRESIVALDGLVIVVSSDNPIRSISISEAARIFAGDITNWSELGGLDEPINVYSRNTGSGTYDTFVDLVMTPNGLSVTSAALPIDNNTDISDRVATDAGAIGFTGFAYTRGAKVVPIRQECGMLSEPSAFSIKTEEYPLTRRLYLYDTEADAPVHAENLVEFASTDAAVPYIEDAGFVSLATDGQGLGEQGLRISYAMTGEEEFSLPLMREMLREFQNAERLSTTFRFTPGSSQLTVKSQRDAEDFAEDIVDGKFDGKEIILVGFTDSIGQFELNRALAERRAQGVLFTIAEAVSEIVTDANFEGADISVQGYGELTPVGCNTTFQGRVANRRVEVWVR